MPIRILILTDISPLPHSKSCRGATHSFKIFFESYFRRIGAWSVASTPTTTFEAYSVTEIGQLARKDYINGSHSYMMEGAKEVGITALGEGMKSIKYTRLQWDKTICQEQRNQKRFSCPLAVFSDVMQHLSCLGEGIGTIISHWDSWYHTPTD